MSKSDFFVTIGDTYSHTRKKKHAHAQKNYAHAKNIHTQKKLRMQKLRCQKNLGIKKFEV